jgi:hypothetical protein
MLKLFSGMWLNQYYLNLSYGASAYFRYRKVILLYQSALIRNYLFAIAFW